MKQSNSKKFNIVFSSVLFILFTLAVLFNVWMSRIVEDEKKYYLVEINQAMQEIKAGSDFVVDENIHRNLVNYEKLTDEMDEESFYVSKHTYEIRSINDVIYRFDYKLSSSELQSNIRFIINMVFIILLVFLIAVFCYLWKHMLKPFRTIEEMPFNLSKGILNESLKEEKTRYFGRFIWGLDLLRDKLETQKAEELKLQKEKKTLILSISHDIKTPLSAIKLYTKALEQNLYQTKEEQNEVIHSIEKHAGEIEEFVSQITKASREDFLELEVDMSEFFLNDLMSRVVSFYKGKLELLRIPFIYDEIDNCLLKGDINRLEEIIQNVIENAIKYGDGNRIQITCDQEEYCRLIAITNTGCTLKEEELPHIFDEFWRGSNVKAEEGSGLGLYICKELIHKMDGHIYAKIEGDEMQVTIVVQMI